MGVIWCAYGAVPEWKSGGNGRSPRKPVASSGTIPTCKNLEVTPLGIKPRSHWWEASALNNCVSPLFLVHQCVPIFYPLLHSDHYLLFPSPCYSLGSVIFLSSPFSHSLALPHKIHSCIFQSVLLHGSAWTSYGQWKLFIIASSEQLNINMVLTNLDSLWRWTQTITSLTSADHKM